MKTIKQAANEYAESILTSNFTEARDGFKAGVAFAQRWISVYEALPDVSNRKVLVKDDKDGFVSIFIILNEASIKDLRHCSYTHWRLIEIE